MRYSVSYLKRRVKAEGYIWHSKPYQLNIIGIRSENTTPNAFDDWICVAYMNDSGSWVVKQYAATTDPSTYYLLNPMRVEGTALMMAGQYRYKLGTHKGQYEALVPNGAVDVLRQYQRDAVLDFFNGNYERCLSGCGLNVHRANAKGTTEEVNLYSAGCQVFANADNYAEFIALCRQHRARYGNDFLYTLIDYRAESRRNKRWALYALLFLLVALALIIAQQQGYIRLKIPKLSQTTT